MIPKEKYGDMVWLRENNPYQQHNYKVGDKVRIVYSGNPNYIGRVVLIKDIRSSEHVYLQSPYGPYSTWAIEPSIETIEIEGEIYV